jgi:hypothetical protein
MPWLALLQIVVSHRPCYHGDRIALIRIVITAQPYNRVETDTIPNGPS